MVDYNYGIKYSSQIDLVNQMEKIRKILKKPSIINLLKSNDILSVYNAVHSMNYLRSVSDLTDFFIINNIDFLKYTDEIPIECFADTYLSYIDIPSHIKIIGYEAFFQTDLEEIVIPGTVNELSSNVFSQTMSLKTVIIEEGVKKIGSELFRYCDALENIKLPASITSIGYDLIEPSSPPPKYHIECPRESYAAEYCRKNDLNFKVI